MSMYSDYIFEHHGDITIEIEHGFVTYRYLNKTQVYIVDLYIMPHMRRGHLAAQLADQVVERARDRGCNELIGTVVPNALNSTSSIKVLLAYGMTIKSAGENLLIFGKAI